MNASTEALPALSGKSHELMQRLYHLLWLYSKATATVFSAEHSTCKVRPSGFSLEPPNLATFHPAK